MLKKQTVKFKVGEIITNPRNNFRRQIIRISFEEIDRQTKVMYTYKDEDVDRMCNPTGNFVNSRTGYCSQDHLVNWKQGR